MALTQTESAALMNDATFKGRVKVCCLKYAGYIMLEPTNTPAHNTRVTWARKTVQFPDQVANETTPPTVMDAAVQEAGATIEDGALQISVETTINSLL